MFLQWNEIIMFTKRIKKGNNIKCWFIKNAVNNIADDSLTNSKLPILADRGPRWGRSPNKIGNKLELLGSRRQVHILVGHKDFDKGGRLENLQITQ